jgi:hypothetical protein
VSLNAVFDRAPWNCSNVGFVYVVFVLNTTPFSLRMRIILWKVNGRRQFHTDVC